MSSLIDPYDLIAPKHYGTRGTPHDAWTLLREKSPVHRCEFGGDFEDFWAITRHADIIDVSSKPHLFSNREGPMVLSRLQKIQVARRSESPMGQMRTIIEMVGPARVEQVAGGVEAVGREGGLAEPPGEAAHQVGAAHLDLPLAPSRERLPALGVDDADLDPGEGLAPASELALGQIEV